MITKALKFLSRVVLVEIFKKPLAHARTIACMRACVREENFGMVGFWKIF